MQKLEIEKFNFKDNYFFDNEKNKKWTAESLYEEVKKEKLKPFKLPLLGINTGYLPIDNVSNIMGLLFHIQRINNLDKSIPIVLDTQGYIADGWHRVMRAILDNDDYIMAYRLKEMPLDSMEYNTDNNED